MAATGLAARPPGLTQVWQEVAATGVAARPPGLTKVCGALVAAIVQKGRLASPESASSNNYCGIIRVKPENPHQFRLVDQKASCPFTGSDYFQEINFYLILWIRFLVDVIVSRHFIKHKHENRVCRSGHFIRRNLLE